MKCPNQKCGAEWVPRKGNPVKCPRCWTHLKGSGEGETRFRSRSVVAGTSPDSKRKSTVGNVSTMGSRHSVGCKCLMCRPPKSN
jgi:hypothetical protein